MFTMREACRQCGGTTGTIETRNGQDCVFCAHCGRYAYNAPRTETGRAVRSLATRPGITPAQRARVFEAHGWSCIGCGATPPVRLELGHLLRREEAERIGMLDDLIDSEWNLAPMCAECNSGERMLPEPALRLIYRVLLIKATPR